MQSLSFKFLFIFGLFMFACANPAPKADDSASGEAANTTSAVQAATEGVSSPTSKEASSNPRELLEEVEEKYSKTPSISMNVTKTLKLKLLEQERSQSGTLELKKTGRFRLELEGSEKSLAVTDGKTIWVVSFPTDLEFDNIIRVVRSKDPKRIQSQALLAFLLGKGSLLKHFSVKSKKETKDIVTYELVAKEKQEDMKSLSLSIDKKNKEILQASYSDSLDNETKFEFSKTNFSAKTKDSRFKFEVPKGAEVTDL